MRHQLEHLITTEFNSVIPSNRAAGLFDWTIGIILIRKGRLKENTWGIEKKTESETRSWFTLMGKYNTSRGIKR